MAEICVIGDRRSGKTTYLATLLNLPDRVKREFKGLEITPQDQCAEELRNLGQNVIAQRRNLAPTQREVELNLHIKFPSVPGFDFTATDYSGELIGRYAAIPEERDNLKPYLPRFFSVNGWLIMISAWELERDTRTYQPAFEYLLNCWHDECQKKPKLKSLRVAVVLNKCERGELWPYRLDPEYDFFKLRLPKTYNVFRKYFPSTTDQLGFFACSSFGILGDTALNQDSKILIPSDPRPNCKVYQDGTNPDARAELKDPSKWKPFGLISPLYWLKTGMRLKHEWL